MEEQFVIFNLAEQEYGINITAVQEIIRPPKVIKLPNSPSYVLGVTNLRGSIIPVIDLQARLGFRAVEIGEQSRVIIIRVNGGSYGVIVDAVQEVLRLGDDQIEEGDGAYHDIDRHFVYGIAKTEERLIILLQLPSRI